MTVRTTPCHARPGPCRWLAFVTVLLLSACGVGGGQYAGPAPQVTKGLYKIGNPYHVDGQWYYPRVDYNYEERGVASWYGPNFHGKPTANGEIFDMNAVSAAHKTLPLPSVVRVTNLENGRSIVVRVNDRGPFARGRVIDLSKRAAELLGFADKGTAMVHVRLLAEESLQAAREAGADGLPSAGPPPPRAAPSVTVTVESLQPVEGVAVAASPPPPFNGVTGTGGGMLDATRPQLAQANAAAIRPQDAAPTTGADRPDAAAGVTVLPVASRPQIYVQAGAFARYDNANRLRARLSVLGPPVRITQVYVTNQPLFRVRIGPLASVAEADRTLERVVGAGIGEAQIVVD